jgi:hypothetical protein
MKTLLVVGLAFALASCAAQPIRMVSEKADTDAQLAYVTVATLVNAYEGRPGADIAKAEGIKLQAWKALVLERNAYALTGTVDLKALMDLVSQAKGL